MYTPVNSSYTRFLFQNQSCIDLCASQDGMRGRMMVGVGLVFFQQVTMKFCFIKVYTTTALEPGVPE